jgi:type I restriction enzyme S subunit
VIDNSWKRTKLGVVCNKVGSGVTPRGGSNVYQKQGISLIRSQNVYDFRFDYNGLVFIDEDQAKRMQNAAVKPLHP